jgi:tagatose-1,6-bisphosphate aldolase non-catalytic subunit AgaZ/GatZ
MHDNKPAQLRNLPSNLQVLIEAAISARVDSPDRDTHWESIEEALSQGDHRLAKILLDALCNQQNALRSGIPPALQAHIDSAIAERVNFPGRDTQRESIEEALSKGDHRLAKILLDALCKQQDNLRNYNQH